MAKANNWFCDNFFRRHGLSVQSVERFVLYCENIRKYKPQTIRAKLSLYISEQKKAGKLDDFTLPTKIRMKLYARQKTYRDKTRCRIAKVESFLIWLETQNSNNKEECAAS